MSQPINFSELSFDQLPPEDRTTDPANQIYVSAVRQLETNQSSIGSKIALLGFSVFIFVALGRFAWDWNFVISLVPILFIHELGHWLAMKFFGYRNIKMFFIPLFGAAVSGRHYNIAAWKKAVVALAGPVPSIFLASAIGVIAMIWRIDWIHPFIGLALVLNVLNLLPLLPLDGGWVAHIILFSRTMILSLLFRAFALVCMAIFAYLTGSYMLIAFSIFFALSLPVVFKQSKIVHRLKRESLPQPENDRIPASAIERILPEIQQEKIPANNPQQYAQQIVEIYETVNTKPPGVWASLALLAIYSMSVLAPIAYGVVYVVRQGDPRQTLMDQQSVSWEGDREQLFQPLQVSE